MNRIKEIVFVLALGFLFILTVQFSMSISIKPSAEQRIPIIREARFELSGHPFSLIKEIISTELFEVKNQAFLNELHQLTSSNRSKNTLNDIQMDLNQAMSFLMIQSDCFKGPLVHFRSVERSDKKRVGKQYVQLGKDVFYAPSAPLTSKQISWILKNVEWKTRSILPRQFIVLQGLNGELSEGTIQWNKEEMSYVTSELKTNQTLILSPRFFHYSNQFPSKVLSSIPEKFSLRCLFLSLDRLSINYDGGKLTEDEQFPFAPSFEVLLEYENPRSMEKALQTAQSVFDTLDWKENEVKMGSQEIFFKRTSTKTLYICSNKAQFCPNGNPNITRCQTGFLCKGDLGRLTSIKNTGWAGLVLDMIPAFRASKELFDGTKEVKSSKNGMEITFKPEKTVLHELLKTLVVYGQE
jgi:hypothetical protein